jgi:predicted alpha/beta-hydrolase family hydrolase
MTDRRSRATRAQAAQRADRKETAWRIAVGDDTTTAVFEPATGSSGEVFVCAHGAGGHKDDPGMRALAGELRARGLDVIRFNFLYREKGSGRPDPMPRLQACIAAVVARARAELEPDRLLIGGRSMGGRAASMLAAEGFACDGLLLFAYPLHPARQPNKLRDAHLRKIALPVLCFNGTRDPLCDRSLMERTLGTVRAPWEMHWLDSADHGFHVLKSSGRTDADVLKEIGAATGRWLDRGVRSQPGL